MRTETAIGERPVSTAAAAVELARGVHGDLGRCGGLLVGTGDMGELVAEALLAGGLGHFVVIHPRAGRAEAMARTLNCHVAPFEDLARALADGDILVTALGARRSIVTAEMVKAALKSRRKRPVLLVDASIPGDIDTAVERLDGAFLYDLNDLEGVAMRGRASREIEAGAAMDIIDDEVARFLRGRAARAAVPTLTALRRHFETAREAAIADAAGNAEKATRLLINRLLHGPSEALREIAALGSEGAADLRGAERALNRLFRLGDSAPEDEK